MKTIVVFILMTVMSYCVGRFFLNSDNSRENIIPNTMLGALVIVIVIFLFVISQKTAPFIF